MQEACVQKREAQRGGCGGAEGLLVCHGPSCGQEERGGSGAERKVCWKIEDEDFNIQNKQGNHLEHQYSKDYQVMKNYYYLTQIGHMAAQIMEAWEKLWSQDRQSRKQRHRRVLESLKKVRLKENREEIGRRIQIRLEPE